MSTVVVALFAVLALTGAVWVITLHNLFRAALSLGVVLLAVAGLFLVLEAEFLAFVQILVYVGAILTLVIFAVMLTTRRPGNSEPGAGASRQRIPAAVVSTALFVLLVLATSGMPQPDARLAAPVALAALGQHLVTTLILPFEVISLVFVAAIVGAIVVAAPRQNQPGE